MKAQQQTELFTNTIRYHFCIIKTAYAIMNQSTYNYFIKGDLSGIQEFIFNVKSEKAARVLKARSIFVEVLTRYTKACLFKEIGIEKMSASFDGGGSFYMKIQDKHPLPTLKKSLKTVEQKINESLQDQGIYVALSVVEATEGISFSDLWTNLAKVSEKDKLRKYALNGSAFEPFDYDVQGFEAQIEQIAQQTTYLKQSKQITSYLNRIIKGLKESVQLEIDEGPKIALRKWNHNKDGLNLFDSYRDEIIAWQEQFARSEKENYEIRRDSIIDFNALAFFAKERTGTNKIGILKMDVDNLGLLFNRVSKFETAIEISALLSDFFQSGIARLLEQPVNFDYQAARTQGKVKNRICYPNLLGDNIYTIFSGGDDCIFVGAWDAILEFAPLIRSTFDINAQKIKKQLEAQGVVADDDLKLPPTLSGGIELVEPTYPVVRFADLANEALEQSKQFKYAKEPNRVDGKKPKPSKNKATLFNQTITWKEWEKVQDIAYNTLKENIEKEKLSRAVLERIRQSETLFGKRYEEALKGATSIPSVSKLFYFVRNAGSKEMIKQLSNDLVKPYAQDLIAAFTKKGSTNPMKYPVAARWAELLTRKSK